MKASEMRTIAGWIGDALRSANEAAALQRIRGQVIELCRQFPAPTTAE
jgi:glycine hydroxymethyltransferase